MSSFQIGERVRIKNFDLPGARPEHKVNGTLGTVVRLFSDLNVYYSVRLDSAPYGDEAVWHFEPKELERV